MSGRVPFNRAPAVGTEGEYLRQVLAGNHLSGDGPFTARCQELLEHALGTGKALLTTSGTHALEMAALLCEISPGDEVVVPSFTFTSTANAFLLRGARLIFADVRPDTLNLDDRQLPRLVTPRTRAIVPVHYGGIACEMDTILTIAAAHGCHVVEDNAHGLFGSYGGRPLGSLGAFGVLSFHESKNFSCGEGGALLLNEPGLVAAAEVLREKGTDRSRFFRGEIDKYTWVGVGSSYLLAEPLAAILWAQLEARERVQGRRRQLWERYLAELQAWALAQGVQLPVVPPGCGPSYHLFHLLLPTASARTAFLAHLREREVSAVFHYVSLHQTAMGRRHGSAPEGCPVAESVGDRLARLPMHFQLSDDEQARVLEAVQTFTA